MDITLGRGNKRQSITLPHVSLRRGADGEQIAWNLKVMLHERGVIANLGGRVR